MNKYFNEIKLGELTEIIAGGDKPKNFSEKKTAFNTVPVFANAEGNNGLQGYTDLPRIIEPAVTISARGSKVGFAALRKEPFFPIVRLLTLIPQKDKLDVDYLFYNLKLNRQNGTGSGQPQITIPEISEKIISVPPLIVQQKVASVLSTLDAKIELNNRINAELEAMAKTLYDYWFVQFDFPNEEGKPYKSSGGTMVWNEGLKREIPEGWEVVELVGITTLLVRGISPTYIENDGIPVLNQKCIRNKTIDFSFARRHHHVIKSAEAKLIQIGDILVNSTGVGTLGRVAIVKRLDESLTTVDSHVTIVRINKDRANQLYIGYSLTEKQSDIEQLGEGSTGQTELSRSNLEKLKLILPPIKLQETFEKIIEPQFQKIALNEKENQQLAELRDWLLPMLMNGQVKVQ
ncbi:restriction endonuclease subunit S [Runella sp. MFBS21]|uniref:restriction endonuclease subunit S n=1 Tax=Runella sp. MFBS21 TaxID=3034018 RepID=UPI0023F7A0FD|nr:restriction endonuclease subunit S [Runella sp. MFBS21]MDF7821167.1 restriction endonuclease subunit S [Runella sp. MFBS21]